jgi:hypothetical protein
MPFSGVSRNRNSGKVGWNETLAALVIPGKAGIHLASPCRCVVYGLDSRFRGNDRALEVDPNPNDTTIGFGAVTISGRRS